MSYDIPTPTGDITLPDGHYNADSRGVCVICARQLIRDTRPFMWAACVPCRRFDRALATTIDAKVILPLGLHSIMNGAAIKLNADKVAQQRQIDKAMKVARGWQTLWDYKKSLVTQMAKDAGWDGLEQVPWQEWTATYPYSPQTSLEAYRNIVHANYQWIEQLAPKIFDDEWMYAEAAKQLNPEEAN